MYSLSFVFLMGALSNQPFWLSACEHMVQSETVYHNDKYTDELLYAIPTGIYLASVVLEEEPYDVDYINMCALAVAVARKESTYNPKAKNGTCYGLYQITVSTAKDIIKDFSFFNGNYPVKEHIYDPVKSTVLFVLLFNKFYGKYHSMEKALYRYNNSRKHTKSVMDMFNQIRREGYNVGNF
jgi:hypothetical protein